MDAYRKESDNALLVLGCLVLALFWTRRHYFISVMPWLLLLTLIPVMIIILLYIKRHRSITNDGLVPEMWDKMEGVEFEEQVVIWLRRTYKDVSRTEYFDSGIDIVAAKDGKVVGVQVKRSSRKVGVSAVRAAMAGLRHYGCSQAMVVTNSEFTLPAIRLAEENDCVLIDGDTLRSSLYSAAEKPLAIIK